MTLKETDEAKMKEQSERRRVYMCLCVYGK